jgi:hypothetical protein
MRGTPLADVGIRMGDESDGTLPRRYANRLDIGFTRDEIVLDFGQQFDDAPARIHTGIVTSPRAADGFLEVLRLSLDEHRRLYQSDGDDS